MSRFLLYLSLYFVLTAWLDASWTTGLHMPSQNRASSSRAAVKCARRSRRSGFGAFRTWGCSSTDTGRYCSLVAYRIFPCRTATTFEEATASTNPEALTSNTYGPYTRFVPVSASRTDPCLPPDFIFIDAFLVTNLELLEIKRLQPRAKVGGPNSLLSFATHR